MHLRALGPLGLAWTRVTVPATDVVRVQPGIRDFLRDRKHSLRRPLHEWDPGARACERRVPSSKACGST